MSTTISFSRKSAATSRLSARAIIRYISTTLRAHSLAVMATAGAITAIATFLSLDILASVAAIVTLLTLKNDLI